MSEQSKVTAESPRNELLREDIAAKLDAAKRSKERETTYDSRARDNPAEYFYDGQVKAYESVLMKLDEVAASSGISAARLRLERDSAREQFDRHVEWAAESLQQLRSYVQHMDSCGAPYCLDCAQVESADHSTCLTGFNPPECTCGLDDVLKTLEGK